MKRIASLFLILVIVSAMIPAASLPLSADEPILPSGYTQVPYIDSDGVAYIDTGIAAAQNDRFELRGAWLQSKASSIMGSGTNSTSADRIQMHYGGSGGGVSLRFRGTMSTEKAFTVNSVYEIVIDLVNNVGTINGETVLNDDSGTLRSDINVFLFAKNINGSVDTTYQAQTRIYSYRHYRNNTIIRNMVPCKRNSDNEFGLYDTVNGVFYTNANSSGSFSYGTLSLTCHSAIVKNADTGETLFVKAPDNQESGASTAKIMVCILAIENLDLDSRTLSAVSGDLIGGTTMNLHAGESLPVREALYGLMLPSGNDAAMLLARTIAGTYADFVAMMNSKAAELGMTHAHYSNPSGMDDANYYITVEDLATLTQYAMQNETFRTVVGTKNHTIPADDYGAQEHVLTNTNQLLGVYEGVCGVKTGTTAYAHVVEYASRDGINLIAVVLGSTSAQRYVDARKLLDFGFEAAAAQSYTVTASGNVLTVTNPATGYTMTSTITATDSDYTGSPVETATVTTVCSSGTWNPYYDVTYVNNVAAGTATASISYGGQTASTTFQITPPSHDAHLDPVYINASLSLLDNININYKLKNDGSNDLTGYTNLALVVEDGSGNEVARITDWATESGKIVAKLEIVAKNVNTIYAIHVEGRDPSGHAVYGSPFNYGVVSYCDYQIANAESQTLKTLCQSIKNYGSTAASYFAALHP